MKDTRSNKLIKRLAIREAHAGCRFDMKILFVSFWVLWKDFENNERRPINRETLLETMLKNFESPKRTIKAEVSKAPN